MIRIYGPSEENLDRSQPIIRSYARVQRITTQTVDQDKKKKTETEKDTDFNVETQTGKTTGVHKPRQQTH